MASHCSNLIELLSLQVQEQADSIAIKDSTSALTYRDTFLFARKAAAILQQNGIRSGNRIVCISSKNTESMVCFYAILMCGGIPVMIDREDGVATNREKIKEVKSAGIILDKGLEMPFDEFPGNSIFYFSDLLSLDRPAPEEVLLHPVSYPETCYILLTSGTTGKPKAVQLSHENVMHYTYSIYQKLGSPQNVRAAHVSTFAADLGLTNTLVALVAGGMLRIINKTEATDPAVFNTIIEEDAISLLKITPSHLLSLVSNLKNGYKKPIETIVLGGEKLSWETVDTILSLGICDNLFNHYGPTETTIGAIAFRITTSSPHYHQSGSVPLGAPIGQGACFLESPQDNIGELYVTGPGVSIGYFENEEENNKKFFLREINGRQTLCYRTGDICRKLDDGNYEFLYRTDRQVKVNGYRVELGEIELAMAAHPDIENVIVSLATKDEHTILNAYIKLLKGSTLTANELKNWLLNKLPRYKVPVGYFFYKKAPYNSNGKIDMNALKKSFEEPGIQKPAAVNEVVDVNSWPSLLESCWKKVLDTHTVNANDNFFETGGDSLLGIQLIGRLQRYGYKVHITDINNNPVFSDFAALNPERIQEQEKEHRHSTGAQKDHFTFSQSLFLQQESFDQDKYCQCILLETGHKVRVREMALAFSYVRDSHLQLTGGFTDDEHEQAGAALGTSILHGKNSIVLQIQEICHSLLNEISIENNKLLAAHLFIDPAGKDYLYLACHHLVVDVISWNIIIDELLDYYEQIIKDQLPVVNPENAVKHFYASLPEGEGILPSLEQAALQRLPVIHRLPDQRLHTHPLTTTEVCSIRIPEETSAFLKQIDEKKQSTSLSGYLLSLFTNALLEEFSLPAITIDIEFHGRPQHGQLADLSRSVAWWSTTLPVTFDQKHLDPDTCSALIDQKAEAGNLINAYPDAFYNRSTIIPDIRFNYLGRFPDKFENSVISMSPSSFNPGTTRSNKAHQEYKLCFTARFIGASLIIDLQYQQKMLTKSNVDNIVRGFLAKLGQQHAPLLLQSGLPSVGQPLYSIKAGNRTAKRRVFLTGATGFLGIHILNELTRFGEAQVYCLVRGESQQQAESRLQEEFHYYFGTTPAPEVVVLKGNISSPQLGLSKEDYHTIATSTDLIIHAAADINLLKSYADLEKTNIDPLHEIIRLAKLHRPKELHYVSTLAVSGCARTGSIKQFSEDELEYGQTFVSDYERTKFEAEKLVRKAFNEAHIKGKIYRVGHVAADAVAGRFQKNMADNRIFQIIKGMLLLKKIPRSYVEKVSFSFVDVVARGIVNSAIRMPENNMQCLHIENPQYLSFQQLAEMLTQLGHEVEVVDAAEFNIEVASFEGSVADKKVISLMDNWIRRSEDFPRRVRYMHGKSLDLIAGYGLYFPKLSLEWFGGLIDEGIRSGYFVIPRHQLHNV